MLKIRYCRCKIQQSKMSMRLILLNENIVQQVVAPVELSLSQQRNKSTKKIHCCCYRFLRSLVCARLHSLGQFGYYMFLPGAGASIWTGGPSCITVRTYRTNRALGGTWVFRKRTRRASRAGFRALAARTALNVPAGQLRPSCCWPALAMLLYVTGPHEIQVIGSVAPCSLYVPAGQASTQYSCCR